MTRNVENYDRTRRTLIERLKNWDDARSWRDFFNTYWKLIYNTARKGGLSHEEAEDVVQDTVVTVCKKIKDLKYDPALGSFKGWLLNTTRWRIEDLRRKRLPQKPKKEESGEEAGRRTATEERIPDPASLDLDAVWEREWQQNLVDAALARVKEDISPKYYQIYDCYVQKGWPAKRVAQTFDVNVAQVHLIKHRVLSELKRAIQRLEANPF